MRLPTTALLPATLQGMARFGHLADGRLKLVLVKRCSALQYLRFLLTMSQTGKRVVVYGCGHGQVVVVGWVWGPRLHGMMRGHRAGMAGGQCGALS